MVHVEGEWDRSEEIGFTDALTGLPNRAGFEAILDHEERRCRRYGGDPAVFVIDLTPADGRMVAKDIGAAATTVSSSIRDTDALARVDRGRLAVLATHCDDPAFLAGRLKLWLELAGIHASVRGRRRGDDLLESWREMSSSPQPSVERDRRTGRS
jgi:hypothetical protein